MIECTSWMSAEDRTNDSATRSAPLRSPQRKSSRSFSERAGTLTETPGRLNPLLLETIPPSITTVCTRGPTTLITCNSIRPSSTRTRSPGLTSPGSPAKVVETMFASPGQSSVVTMNSSPTTNSTGPDANRPSLIFGPWRSTKIATLRPEISEASRTQR